MSLTANRTTGQTLVGRVLFWLGLVQFGLVCFVSLRFVCVHLFALEEDGCVSSSALLLEASRSHLWISGGASQGSTYMKIVCRSMRPSTSRWQP
mgnify:CR=1 FL=1